MGGIKASEVPEMIADADLDKDGRVSYAEFCTYVFDMAPTSVRDMAKRAAGGTTEMDGQKKLNDMLSEVFKCFDLDKDGRLERVELLDVTEMLYDKIGEVFNVKSRR